MELGILLEIVIKYFLFLLLLFNFLMKKCYLCWLYS